MNSPYVTVPEAIDQIQQGNFLIVVDGLNRENEGDLFIAAQFATAAKINFMITYGKGLVCVPITAERAAQLDLQLMVPADQNQEYTKCNYTISVDAHEGIHTGISAYDRARTILILANSSSQPRDLVRPGHVFPLIAKDGGVLERAGHTEALIDLTKLAGLDPSGVLCEIIGEDGNMLRGEALENFAHKHHIHITTIEDLIAFKKNYVK